MMTPHSSLLLTFTLLISSVLSTTPSPGCANPKPPARNDPTTPLTISVPSAGGPRTYLLSHPDPPPNSPSPQSLILAFHGKGQTASQFSTQTQLTSPSFRLRDSIVVFPQGIDSQWLGDPTSPPRRSLDDIAFAQALLKELVEEYCVDLSRIYLIGFSNGGGLTHLLACDPEVSAQVAAVAIVSGAFYKDRALKGDEVLFGVCENGRDEPLPVLEMHGGADPVIHYDGKGTPDGETYAIGEWLGGWRERNGCAGAQSELRRDIHDGSVQKTEWWCGRGRGGAKDVVVHYFVRGFGHGWPSTREQDDDGQRYGPVGWNGTTDIVGFLAGKILGSQDEGGKGKEMKDEL